jgi:hypothetical protein
MDSKVTVVIQVDKEASQTRDYCVAKGRAPSTSSGQATRAARPDPSLRKERLFRMTRLKSCVMDNKNGGYAARVGHV